jgi:hypothetical protein
MCPSKMKGIFVSRYYLPKNVEAIDVYFLYKYYIILELNLKNDKINTEIN